MRSKTGDGVGNASKDPLATLLKACSAEEISEMTRSLSSNFLCSHLQNRVHPLSLKIFTRSLCIQYFSLDDNSLILG